MNLIIFACRLPRRKFPFRRDAKPAPAWEGACQHQGQNAILTVVRPFCSVAAGLPVCHLAIMSNQTGLVALLATPHLADLGPGPRPGVESEASLTAKIEHLSAGSTLPRDQQELARALILLWHDHLDAAHSIAQAIDNPDGAFVHGMVHRREPDYGNATYWFRRTGKHPAFAELARHVEATFGPLGDQDLKQQLLPRGKWDPFGFISACEKAAQRPGSDASNVQLREVQRLEFELLLGWFVGGLAN